jgi:hypothetical protein
MVSRPVRLRIKHPSGAYDQIFISLRQLRVCWFGAPSLTRGRVCRLQLLLALASAVIFYCLRFETCLFVASYDSQGQGGGIRPSLHTGFSSSTDHSVAVRTNLYLAVVMNTISPWCRKLLCTLLRRRLFRSRYLRNWVTCRSVFGNNNESILCDGRKISFLTAYTKRMGPYKMPVYISVL